MEFLNAKELIAKMKSKEILNMDDQKKYFSIMVQYIRNYNRAFILDTISRGDIDLRKKLEHIDISDLNERLESMRTLLTVNVPSITSVACAVFRANDYNFAYVYFIASINPKPIFISVGGNSISSDGEWRPHICDMGAYNLLIGRYIKIIENIIDEIGIPDVEYDMFYSSNMNVVESDIRKIIDVEKYTIYLYALAVFSGLYKPLLKNVSKKFISFLGNRRIPKIDDVHAADMYKLLGSCCGCAYSDPHLPTRYNIVNTGQKFILLSTSAVNRPFNIFESEWNELSTIRSVANIVLNMISPCFSIYCKWFFIYNVNKSLFNIPTISEKIVMSDEIQMSDDGSQSKILSDVIINVISENVGNTFIENFPAENIERYLFDILFGLLTMNIKLNKMHCDLHGNNVSIVKRSNAVGTIVYEVNGFRYVLPHTGAYACIIDFSRSANISDINFIETVINKYEIYFSEWTSKNISKIITMCINALNGDIISFAKIVSAFDIYDLCESLLTHCTEIGNAAKLITKCKNFAADILMSIFDDNEVKHWANAILIDKLFTSRDDWFTEQKICGYYADVSELKYSISDFDSLPKPLKTAPMIAYEGDDPVDTNALLTFIIRANYELQDDQEKLLYQIGM